MFMCLCVCHSSASSSSFFFFLLPPQTVLLLCCITCCSSLAFISGLVEFPGQLRKPVGLSSPPIFRSPVTLPHPPPSCSYYPPILFFPDCTASVHKSCRDSLPVCAKVKMKVTVPSDAIRNWFFSVLLSCSQYWFEFLIYAFIISLASFPNSSLQFQTQALFLQSHWGTNVSDSLL